MIDAPTTLSRRRAHHRQALAERVGWHLPTFLHASLPRVREGAKTPLSVAQKFTLALSLFTFPLGLWQHLLYATLVGVVTAFTAFYLVLLVFKLALYWQSSTASTILVSASEIALRKTWPIVTVLCPMYKEAEVLPALVERLGRLHYPKDRLQVLLLLETDDTETMQALDCLTLPAHIQALCVPPSLPRSKPKICNLGLKAARGEFLVIYDAEDLPDLDQIQKFVLGFSKVGPKVGCLQAMLRFTNHSQNLLTRFFTAEYAMYFGLILPGLGSLGLPTPLGGTSNCFRTSLLRSYGGWDPYNVTEDLDLGMLMARAGMGVQILDSYTDETATWLIDRWISQRSRWIKGHIQTYFVHMRNPYKLWRELGTKGFVTFQLIVGGTPLILVSNPIFWGLTLFGNLIPGGREFISGLFPGPLAYIGVFSLVIGNAAFIWMFMAGCLKGQPEQRHNAPFMLLVPLYWALMSIAGWKAFYQFAVKPHHWEKTNHAGALAAAVSPAFIFEDEALAA